MELKRNKTGAVKRTVSKAPITNRGYVLRDLLDIIAKYLDIKELRTLAQTCRLWRDAVTREMQFRCLQRILVYEEEHLFVLQGFVNVNPHLVMLFAKHDFKRAKRRERTLCEQYTDHFPNILVTMGFDDVFTEANIIKVDFPDFDENRNFADFKTCEVPGLLIPNHPTIDVKMSWCTLNAMKTMNPFSNIFSALVSKEYKEKSILIVFTHGFNQIFYLEEMMKSLEECFRIDHCTLWGGELFQPPCVHHSRENASNILDNTGLVAMSLTNPNLESYSLVVDISDIETDNVYEEVRRFRDGIKIRKQCIGFVIAPEFEDFQINEDDAECNAQANEDAGNFYKINYEKRLMYFFKKLFAGVYFTFLFQDNLLHVFGISCTKGQYRLYHKNSVSVMIITHD